MRGIIEAMKRLSTQEAAQAAERVQEYEYSLAIEGIYLNDREREVMDTIELERMGYEEGVRFAIASCRTAGLLPKA